MGDLHLSNFISMIPDYLLSNDERTMFDWLVFKCSYNFDWYRHSIPQVQRETGIKRRIQDNAIYKFKEIGFLQVKKVYYQNNPYRGFYIDFSELSKENILEQIIKRDSATFPIMFLQFKELAKEQKLQRKRSRSLRKKEIEEEKDTRIKFEELLKSLDDTWNNRREMYNNGELTDGIKPERKKSKTSLSKSKTAKALLHKLMEDYDNTSIENALIAFADDFFRGNISCERILPYFLTYENGDFPVMGRYLDKFNSNYSHK